MINITDKKKCSGCEACVNACPRHCIIMSCDDEGFFYPTADVTKCIHCGICNHVCPMEHKVFTEEPVQKAYASYCNDKEIRHRSSSGGLFSLLALKVISDGGFVFGAAFNDDIELFFECASRKEDLQALCGAKYVQCRVGGSYTEIKSLLERDKTVLFAGTPCQVAGLYSFLGNSDKSKLLLVDFVCHGVPSPVLWQQYIEYRQKEDRGIITAVQFRSKKRSWRQYYTIYKYGNKSKAIHRSDDPYLQSFLKNYSLRPSCYACEFKGTDRIADITLADFWMVNQFISGMDDDEGTSLVVVHSKKGEAVLQTIRSEGKFQLVDFTKVTESNYPMVSSVSCPDERKLFFEVVKNSGWNEIVKKWFPARNIKIRAIDSLTNVKQKIKHLVK